MKISTIILTFAAFALMAPAAAYSQTFIINDKDGWTNIRKAPNARAEIVGQVHKHQVFFTTTNCGDESHTGNWEPVNVYFISEDRRLYGYIFKNNITNVKSFPMIEGSGDFMWHGKSDKDSSVITARNDSITVTMNLVRKVDPNYGPFTVAEEVFVTNGKKRTVIQSGMNGVGSLRLYIGNDGALYLVISNSSDGEPMEVWYTIVDGEVIYHSMYYPGC